MNFPERMPNTRKILAASQYADRCGKLSAFRKAAMVSYWREGKNLEDPQVVAEIAQKAGLDGSEATRAMEEDLYLYAVYAIRQEAQQVGVAGIPTFISGDESVYGCQPYEVLEAFAVRAGAKPKN